MADDLSAPLGRKRGDKRAPAFRLVPGKLPLARIAFGLAAVVILGVVARVVFVKDPMGGRPVAEIGVNSTRNANSLAGDLASADTATITAGPEVPASGLASMVGDDVPDGVPNAPPPARRRCAPTAACRARAGKPARVCRRACGRVVR
jgi:hypothetical protein